MSARGNYGITAVSLLKLLSTTAYAVICQPTWSEVNNTWYTTSSNTAGCACTDIAAATCGQYTSAFHLQSLMSKVWQTSYYAPHS